MKNGCAAVVVLFFFVFDARAQLTLTSDERALTAEAAGSVGTAFPISPYAPFDQEVSRDVTAGGGHAIAHAKQNSTVSPGAMNATGSSSSQSDAAPSGCVLAQATSDFRITFSVATPVQYSFDGSVNGAEFRLAENVSGTVNVVQSPAGTELPYSVGGILRPGRQYTVLAQSSQLANACNGDSFALAGRIH
ncbi:MAG: hypothetical protein ACREJD_15380 [Phycisphaerales bacterium]